MCFVRNMELCNIFIKAITIVDSGLHFFLDLQEDYKTKQDQHLPHYSNTVIGWCKILFEKTISNSKREKLSIVPPVHPSTEKRKKKNKLAKSQLNIPKLPTHSTKHNFLPEVNTRWIFTVCHHLPISPSSIWHNISGPRDQE